MQARKEEMERKHKRAMYYSAVCAILFGVCFVTAAVTFILPQPENPRNGTTKPPPRLIGFLSLSLDRVDLSQASGVGLGSQEFKDEDPHKLVAQAADWVKTRLETEFPRDRPRISVTASLTLSKDRKGHTFRIDPEDRLRHDHFWMFTATGKDHPSLSEAGEARQEAIEKALAASFERRDLQTNLLVHVDRPGYSLELLRVPIGGGSDKAALERLSDPAFVVAVEPLTGNDTLAEKLRAKLRELGLAVIGPAECKDKKETYGESKKPNLTDGVRLARLRNSRITAIVRGTYEQR